MLDQVRHGVGSVDSQVLESLPGERSHLEIPFPHGLEEKRQYADARRHFPEIGTSAVNQADDLVLRWGFASHSPSCRSGGRPRLPGVPGLSGPSGPRSESASLARRPDSSRTSRARMRKRCPAPGESALEYSPISRPVGGRDDDALLATPGSGHEPGEAGTSLL